MGHFGRTTQTGCNVGKASCCIKTSSTQDDTTINEDIDGAEDSGVEDNDVGEKR